jgi:hypothetical protein
MRSSLYHVPDNASLSATWNYVSGGDRGPKAAIKGMKDAVFIKNRYGQTNSIGWDSVRMTLQKRNREFWLNQGHDEKTVDTFFDDLTRMDIEYQREIILQW